jgi:hypothetical protein
MDASPAVTTCFAGNDMERLQEQRAIWELTLAPPALMASQQQAVRLITVVNSPYHQQSCKLPGYGVLGSRRGGENKSRGLAVAVTRLDPRHDPPYGADGHPEDRRTICLALASAQEHSQSGNPLRVQ